MSTYSNANALSKGSKGRPKWFKWARNYPSCRGQCCAVAVYKGAMYDTLCNRTFPTPVCSRRSNVLPQLIITTRQINRTASTNATTSSQSLTTEAMTGRLLEQEDEELIRKKNAAVQELKGFFIGVALTAFAVVAVLCAVGRIARYQQARIRVKGIDEVISWIHYVLVIEPRLMANRQVRKVRRETQKQQQQLETNSV